jgi:hypothetical protein
MIYTVEFRITGNHSIDVDAPSIEDAKQYALEIMEHEDLELEYEIIEVYKPYEE